MLFLAEAYVTVVDIAGLISGAHKGLPADPPLVLYTFVLPVLRIAECLPLSGEGLGNAFLSHIQSVDSWPHVAGTPRLNREDGPWEPPISPRSYLQHKAGPGWYCARHACVRR